MRWDEIRWDEMCKAGPDGQPSNWCSLCWLSRVTSPKESEVRRCRQVLWVLTWPTWCSFCRPEERSMTPTINGTLIRTLTKHVTPSQTEAVAGGVDHHYHDPTIMTNNNFWFWLTDSVLESWPTDYHQPPSISSLFIDRKESLSLIS